jgi:hypothetical protein
MSKNLGEAISEPLITRIDRVINSSSLGIWLDLFGCAIVISLIIRFISAVLKARIGKIDNYDGASGSRCCDCSCPHSSKSISRASYWKRFCHHFWGTEDFWLPYGIGVIELMVYPLMLKAAAIEVVGGWIGIKALGSWDGWRKSRPLYSVYLLGTVSTVVGGYIMYRLLVSDSLPFSVLYGWIKITVKSIFCPA